jgi:hypothetical protein
VESGHYEIYQTIKDNYNEFREMRRAVLELSKEVDALRTALAALESSSSLMPVATVGELAATGEVE